MKIEKMKQMKKVKEWLLHIGIAGLIYAGIGIIMEQFGITNHKAYAAVFLASKEADYITGITIFVDGGWLTG